MGERTKETTKLVAELRALVAREDWTAQRVADELGAGYFSVLNWTSGRNAPSNAYRRPLAALLERENAFANPTGLGQGVKS